VCGNLKSAAQPGGEAGGAGRWRCRCGARQRGAVAACAVRAVRRGGGGSACAAQRVRQAKAPTATEEMIHRRGSE